MNELHAHEKELKGCKSVRLICDGCPGQNKNINVITAMCVWLAMDSLSDLLTVEVVLLVTGHSFMASDRVFGLIEK